MDEKCNIINTNSNLVNIYKGLYFFPIYYKKTKNVFIFDLDETLGSFNDLYILWINLKDIIKFNDLLDLFPEFIRVGIIPIIKYIYKMKTLGICNNIYIYTNNCCSQDFVDLILNYFSYKLKIEKIFDQVIRSFKINDKIVEINRTTSQKTYDDFIRCTLLPRNIKICFIDNSYFPLMIKRRIYYIQPKSYHHNLSKEIIIKRLCNFFPLNTLDNIILENIYNNLNQNNEDNIKQYIQYFESKQKIDMIVAHKIMYHIKYFFYLTKYRKKTKKKLIKYNISRKKMKII